MTLTSAKQAYDYIHSPAFSLDGFKKLYVSAHFKWSEVFTNCTESQIKSAPLKIFENAVLQSVRMEKIRKRISDQVGHEAIIDVSSWYRPPEVNSAIPGAATGSRHLLALATDFVVRGYESVAGNKYIQAILAPVKDILGFCLEITNGDWTHADDRTICIVFKNLGKGRYKTLSLDEIKAFVRKYGK